MNAATSLLQPGTYRLTAEVRNPSPDRRMNQSRLSSWESWTAWPAGMLFVVENDPEFPVNRIRPQGGLNRLSQYDAAFGALVSHLEAVQEQPSDYIARVGAGLVQHYAMGVLDRLGVPLERIAEIMAQMDEEDAGLRA